MICYFNYSVSPYHQKRFSKLQEKFQTEIMFVELASQDRVYPWNSQAAEINAVTLFPGMEFSTVKTRDMVTAVTQLLNRTKPDVVLTVSYDSAAVRAAAIWARRNNVVSISVNDSWKGDKPRFLFWEIIKGFWCRIAYDGMFLSGVRSKAYYQGLGFPESRIWLGQDTIDNDFFAEKTDAIRKEKEVYRQKYKLPEKYFLCVARLSPEKNLERLIRAFSAYKARGGGWDLVIVGSGPLEKILKDLAGELGIRQSVFFAGWKQQDEIPVFYALAACLVLPSVSEPWGNVVNEAMASSLPIMVSRKCGCSPELCLKGVNGFDFDPYSEKAITEVLLKMASDDCDRSRMAQASLELVRRYTLENYAASLNDCIASLKKSKFKLG